MRPAISIIVPVYKVEPYLHACLTSLVEQTLQNIEIIVVNDGSPDGSQGIINEFQDKYPALIRSFKKENGGLSDARNFGLDRAEGHFIGFVDSDDSVSPLMFEEMYRLAMRHQAQMVMCNLHKVDGAGKIIQQLPQIPNMPERVVLKEHLSVFSDISYFACNKIFHRKLFEGRRFKREIHFEDIQLIPQLLMQCDVVAHTQAFHYHYLERPDSISRTHTLQGMDILNAVEDVAQAFAKSKYAAQPLALQNFRILEGVYTYLAYLAYVRDGASFRKMWQALKDFRHRNGLSVIDLLRYKRFGKNYLLSLPLKKKIYYVLIFTGLYPVLRKLLS